MTSLSLADVRWRARRETAGGLPLVSVSFLDPRDRRTSVAVAGVAEYVASLVGKARREYDPDVPAEIAGDRRLGHGLAAVCLGFFRWTARTFAEALPAPVAEALARSGIDSPSTLRLRLFDLVNERFDGFVPGGRRDEALVVLVASLGLTAEDASHLDAALTLDHEDEAILSLDDELHPSSLILHPSEVVARYNRAALAALLRGAERIEFAVQSPGGALVRRLYALCRRLGVYCDIEQAEIDRDRFRLTLAGPDAVVAAPAGAGPRLATAALSLLRHLGPEDGAVAHLVLRERACRFVLDAKLLAVPGLNPAPQPEAGETTSPVPDETDGLKTQDSGLRTSFDSEVEERLARDFESLRRQGRAGGWRLVREPGLLMAGGRVLIPDFALERGALRVFVEVAGFWTPGYIQKKRQALERLSPQTPLVLAAAEGPAAALSGLPFPVLTYRQWVRVPELLALAESRYGDFSSRTEGASARLTRICDEGAEAGWIAEARLAAALDCHSPGEVLRVLASAPLPHGWQHLPGAGLGGPALRASVAAALTDCWEQRGTDAVLTLDEVRALLPGRALPETEDALVALLERLPVCIVARPSLFEVQVRPGGDRAPEPDVLPAQNVPARRATPAPARSAARRPRPAPSARLL